jgi:citrate lyase gamma subunit
VPTDQKVDNKLNGTLEIEDKQVVVDPNNSNKKLQISDNLDPK